MSKNASVGDDALDKAPRRALDFLSGVSRNAQIREVLASYGYTDDVHQEGWSLLGNTGGQSRPAQGPAAASVDVADAVAQLAAWNTRTFALADCGLRHTFPAQHAFLFEGELSAQSGNGAVLAASTFLQRLDALADDPEREATRDDDHAALARLDARSVTPAERARGAMLVATIQAGASKPEPTAPPRAAADHRAAKLAVYKWVDEWSSVARIAISRRDLLIRIGLASPRPRKVTKEAAKPATPPTPPTPPARTVPPARPSAAPPSN